jgi:hypothetical protein
MSGKIKLFTATSGGIVARRTKYSLTFETNRNTDYTTVTYTENNITNKLNISRYTFALLLERINEIFTIPQDPHTNVYKGKELIIEYTDDNNKLHSWKNIAPSGCSRLGATFTALDQHQAIYFKVTHIIEQVGKLTFKL